jgi:hypothetical protein
MSKFLVMLLLIFPLWADDFELLMGKGTKHWNHVQQPVDRDALDRYKSLYDRHQELRFVKSNTTKIPKIVHFIWLGPRAFPPQSVENVRTWMAQNPDWTFKFWTDRPRDPPCHGMETVLVKEYPFPILGKRYAASQNWGEKSDVLRFEILYNQGGVYVDHDANCLQPFAGLHGAYDFYCCLEVPHPLVAGYNITSGNGVIGSRSGHPVVKKVIDLMDERWDELERKYPGNDGFSKTQIVMERTYLALTLALQNTIDLPGNVDIVLPAAHFFAKKGLKPVYSEHFFANSWADLDGKDVAFEKSVERLLTKIDKKVKKVLLLCGLFLSFNLILIAITIISTKKMRST